MNHKEFLTSEEITKFAKVYSLGKVINYYQMAEGYSTNYLIQTKTKKLILTICENKTIQQTQALTDLLIHLHKHNFQTNQVILTKNHVSVLEHNGKPVYLKEYLEGEIVKRPTTQLIEDLGRRIAQLHNLPCPDYIPVSHLYGLDFLDEITSSDIDHPYIEWLKAKLEYIEALIPDQLPTGLIHGDIFPDNLLQKNGKLVAIIDFEEVSNYSFVFDLGMAIVGLLTIDDTVDMKYMKALIVGYQEVRVLEQIEKENLRLAIIYAAVTTSIWRFRQSHIYFPTPEKYAPHQEMVDIADKFYELENSNFMSKVFD